LIPPFRESSFRYDMCPPVKTGSLCGHRILARVPHSPPPSLVFLFARPFSLCALRYLFIFGFFFCPKVLLPTAFVRSSRPLELVWRLPSLPLCSASWYDFSLGLTPRCFQVYLVETPGA